MTIHPLGYVVGRTVPGGTYALAPFENWLAHDALYSKPVAVPHPIVAFIGAQRGMGLSVAELFQLLECDIAEGPVLAECTIELEDDLTTDVTYEVSGRVEAIVRKSGAAFGEFDLATCVFELSDPATGNPVAKVTNVYAIQRSTS